MHIKKVGIVGCGLMGSGIAQTAAEGGFTTIVREPTQELMDKGMERIRSFLAKGVDKGKMSPARRDEVWARIKSTTDLSDLADCDLVIEAIVEDRDAKKALFVELDQVCKAGAFLASHQLAVVIGHEMVVEPTATAHGHACVGDDQVL